MDANQMAGKGAPIETPLLQTRTDLLYEIGDRLRALETRLRSALNRLEGPQPEAANATTGSNTEPNSHLDRFERVLAHIADTSSRMAEDIARLERIV